jgi:hypothetical protein
MNINTAGIIAIWYTTIGAFVIMRLAIMKATIGLHPWLRKRTAGSPGIQKALLAGAWILVVLLWPAVVISRMFFVILRIRQGIPSWQLPSPWMLTLGPRPIILPVQVHGSDDYDGDDGTP